MKIKWFLRTRLARRVLRLFVLCALLPIIGSAIYSYVHVGKVLKEGSQERLERTARAINQGVLDRLAFLRTEIRTVLAPALTDQPAATPALFEGPESPLTTEIEGLAIQRNDGRMIPLLGRVPEPRLTAGQAELLREGESVLSTEASSSEALILMGRAMVPENLSRGIIWAQLHPGYLMGAGEAGETLPRDMELCVFDRSNKPLYCSLGNPAALRERLEREMTASWAYFEWSDQNQDYLAWHRSIFLGSTFREASNWTIVVSMSKARVLEPMDGFKQIFPVAILLALLVVAYLSNIQIRRSMDPLVKLQEGTRRIAAQDFDSRVRVTSGDEFEDLATSFNAMAHRLGRQFNALTAISEIDRAVLSALDRHRIIDTVLSRTRDVLACDGVSVGLPQADGTEPAWTLVGVDAAESEKVVREARLAPQEIRELQDHPEHLLIDGKERRRSYFDLEPFSTRRMSSFLVLPVFIKRELSGVIALGYIDAPAHSEEDLVQARQLADQVAVALSNTRLLEELDQLNWGALTALARTIDAKSPWTSGHSERVTRHAMAIARELGLPPETLEVLNRGGLLHDIGKIGVPAEILDKPGRLDEEEMRIMRSHVTIGARILTPITAYADVIPIVLHHHEWYDGTGYPYGLTREEIPFLARLLAVPDVFDGLSSDRPYRPGWQLPRVMEYIEQHSGSHFDPKIVTAFLAVVAGQQPEVAPPRSARISDPDITQQHGVA